MRDRSDAGAAVDAPAGSGPAADGTGRPSPGGVVALALPYTGRDETDHEQDRAVLERVADELRRRGYEVMPAAVHEPADICRPIADCDVLVVLHTAASDHVSADVTRLWTVFCAVILIVADDHPLSCRYQADAAGYLERVAPSPAVDLPERVAAQMPDAMGHAATLRSAARTSLGDLVAEIKQRLSQRPLRENVAEVLAEHGVRHDPVSALEQLSLMQAGLLLAAMGTRLAVDDTSQSVRWVRVLAPEQYQALQVFLARCPSAEPLVARLVERMLSQVALERARRPVGSHQRYRRYVDWEDWRQLWEELA